MLEGYITEFDIGATTTENHLHAAKLAAIGRAIYIREDYVGRGAIYVEATISIGVGDVVATLRLNTLDGTLLAIYHPARSSKVGIELGVFHAVACHACQCNAKKRK